MSVPPNLSVDGFRALLDDQRCKCLICGHRAHALPAHLKEAHNLTVGQYERQHTGKETRVASSIVAELLRRLERKSYTTDDLNVIAEVFKFTDDVGEMFDQIQLAWPAPALAAPQAEIPTIDKHYKFDPAHTKAISVAIAMGLNTYIEGPSGCGKTELIRQLHARIKRPMMRVNMNGDVTVANFRGEMRADPVKGTYFQEGFLPIAMRAGVLLLLDEVDYAPPHITAVLNPILEGRKPLYIEETGQLVHPAPGFRVIATGNTGGKGDGVGAYTGTEILNTAFLDRFGVKLTVDYMDAKDEIAMLRARFPNMDDKEATSLVKMAGEIRTSFRKGTMTRTLTTRKLVDFGALREHFEKKDAFNLVMGNWLDADDSALIKGITSRVGF